MPSLTMYTFSATSYYLINSTYLRPATYHIFERVRDYLILSPKYLWDPNISLEIIGGVRHAAATLDHANNNSCLQLGELFVPPLLFLVPAEAREVQRRVRHSQVGAPKLHI